MFGGMDLLGHFCLVLVFISSEASARFQTVRRHRSLSVAEESGGNSSISQDSAFLPSNVTFSELCQLHFRLQGTLPEYDDGQIYCNSTWNTLSCWPTTLAGTLAVIQCPPKLGDYPLDATKNATRYCHVNGTWAEKAEYAACVPELPTPDPEDIEHNFPVRLVYYSGYGLSSLALLVALTIFVYFRSLRCLRNTIHCHLMVSFLVRNISWMLVMNLLLPKIHLEEETQWLCKAILVVWHYVHSTNYFWMFVEGLYLHLMVVWAFSADKVKLWVYLLIGWGAPAPTSIAWALTKHHLQSDENCWGAENYNSQPEDYIVTGPILFVLGVNLIFLGTIVWVLITKLRASNSLETRHSRKAVKATLILMPLVGATYMLFLYPPSNDPITTKVFRYTNAFLQSTQGFFVALFYCFFNGEVQNALKRKFSRWQDDRNIINSTRWTRTSMDKGEARTSLCVNNDQLLPLNEKRKQTELRHSTAPDRDRNGNKANGHVTVTVEMDIESSKPLIGGSETVANL
ncbi:corticotropin-releasing factor receptor 1 isoform X1 [Lingula anatina]|uniref:Corticotropin-releasing factor receptor 1 isoform X1 n=1 Tax=Lingula anatina TaxID=7574 RepID=A0A1S3INA9_LINAN|nr:corticotropin-releasing factor receptor 1 isoform X1 [Lingula anatina]|eukprot:XP_013399024.1 corticotropin-releasing factor receptor 1 isoform X1 [Lingula anatina]